ncbi:exported hypothetical protein [Gammaproteobacteria bacterium]
MRLFFLKPCCFLLIVGVFFVVNSFAANESADALNLRQTEQEQPLLSATQDRLAVMKTAADKEQPDEVYDLHSAVKPFSKHHVQAGTKIQAALITGIGASSAGAIVVKIKQDVYDTATGKYLLIPEGSKLLGEYASHNVSSDQGIQRSIAIWFTRIVRPDGTSILLGKPDGTDLLGQAGVEGGVDNHLARIVGAATISALISIGSASATDRGATKAIVLPTITLTPGYKFVVTARKDMVLSPYKSGR